MIRRKTGVRETHRQKKRTFQNTLGQHMDAESKKHALQSTPLHQRVKQIMTRVYVLVIAVVAL